MNLSPLDKAPECKSRMDACNERMTGLFKIYTQHSNTKYNVIQWRKLTIPTKLRPVEGQHNRLEFRISSYQQGRNYRSRPNSKHGRSGDVKMSRHYLLTSHHQEAIFRVSAVTEKTYIQFLFTEIRNTE